ncbi:MAG: hypothetical protein EOP83_20575 [Verrucomicrobiaceae bacterium]|nr:MAG: hypothetical protein EOP83_20575 [Verrucomicrobiaceae bacterium]
MARKLTIHPPCAVRQVGWPTLKPSASNREKVARFIESTFCFRIVPGGNFTKKEMDKWLGENLGPRALVELDSMFYWTEGVWESCETDELQFTYEGDGDDLDDVESVYMFLTSRDATAFKLVFG